MRFPDTKPTRFGKLHRLAPSGLVILACFPLLALAQQPAAEWLPPLDQVNAMMQAQPTVRAAAERVNAAAATQRALDVGSHEFQARTGFQRRQIPDERRRYSEWELEVSRAIRLPGKARLDREIGSSTRRVADLRLADAEHQVARRLLDAWMGWLRSAAVADEMAAQDQLVSREKDALARRVTLGDAARREMDLLEAERATLAAQSLMARDVAQAARQMLAVGFPHIAVPLAAPALPDPQALPEGPQAWRARIIEESAEIGIASGETNRLAKVAERARAERTPDPTVGARVMSDRGGAERVVGVVLSVPFGGSYRSAMAAAEGANAAAAEAEAADVRRTVEHGAWTAVQAAQSKHLQWQSHHQALVAQTSASTRTRRAWELGEAPLSEHLLAQRSLRQARLTEAQARVDALQAALLVRIDAHAMWHSEGEGHGEGGGREGSP